ncbi:NAD(P)-dependent oxidoreductase, partial [Phaeobacter italicus]|uniref:NAD(P)-dependent oxidoreductase n=1 Tax=Phaeobacter italicus TaxID=481446 RepID=UPI002FDED434
MAKVAFLGLGVMGYPMAGHLVKAGHEVTVYNRTTAKAEAWVKEHGGTLGATPAEAAKGADFVMACVGNDDDLRSVCLGETGAFGAMPEGAVFVDHTTVSAKVTRELFSAAAEAGLSFVDAPISGGQAGAENGVLSVMCGGDQAAYDKAEPIIDAYARICRRIGDSGAGQMTKMCNQIAIAGLVQGLSEALHFADKAGLDGRAVVEVISQGAAGSWQMVNRHETMLDDHFEHGFAVDWMRKDLGICLDAADETGASLPVTALVDQFYKDVQKLG